MIKFENPNGYIEITNAYFANLVGQAAQSCFGVTGMYYASPYESIVSAIKTKAKTARDNNSRQGVTVRSENGALSIDLHISVSYGVNITAIVDSIINKVRYTVEEATDLNVSNVNVYVDGLN